MIRKCLNGEMLLTILSSLAQEEVESLSSNVKMGLQMKMKRGELVGFNGCFGYDYHQDTKTITVNETEAETVRLIYESDCFCFCLIYSDCLCVLMIIIPKTAIKANQFSTFHFHL